MRSALSVQGEEVMKKTFVMLAAALSTAAATLPTTGCATLARAGGFKQPVVNFRDLKVEGVGLTGGTLDVILSIYNPNGYKLNATRLTYNLMIDSTALGSGVYGHNFSVRSGDSTIVTLPVTLNYSGLAAAGRQMVGKGSVNYRVTGDVTVSTPVGNFTAPYDQLGRFSAFGGAQLQ
jgi:LEA14-like dessication related protein